MFDGKTHNLVSYGGSLVVQGIVVGLFWQPQSPVQWVLVSIYAAHFIKRCLEVMYVHQFGKNPSFVDEITEYAYYWFFTCWIMKSILSDQNPSTLLPTLSFNSTIFWFGLVIWLIGEYTNLKHHLILSSLRPNAHAARIALRSIPHGGLFEKVSCPHYFGEIVGWTGFFLMSGTIASLVYLIAATVILQMWAQQRHEAYEKEFGQAYKKLNRSSLFPRFF